MHQVLKFPSMSFSYLKLLYDNFIIVGPNNSWANPIYSLGPKARAEKGYSLGSLKQVQNGLGTQLSPRHVRGPIKRKGKNGTETTWEKI